MGWNAWKEIWVIRCMIVVTAVMISGLVALGLEAVVPGFGATGGLVVGVVFGLLGAWVLEVAEASHRSRPDATRRTRWQ